MSDLIGVKSLFLATRGKRHRAFASEEKQIFELLLYDGYPVVHCAGPWVRGYNSYLNLSGRSEIWIVGHCFEWVSKTRATIELEDHLKGWSFIFEDWDLMDSKSLLQECCKIRFPKKQPPPPQPVLKPLQFPQNGNHKELTLEELLTKKEWLK